MLSLINGGKHSAARYNAVSVMSVLSLRSFRTLIRNYHFLRLAAVQWHKKW